MGIVYKAQRNDGKIVAIKFLNPDTNPDRKSLARFTMEGKAGLNLGHPNLVSALDFGESEGTHYIVMEFVEGETLQEAMKTRMAYTKMAEIMAHCANGLHYLHTLDIIHRDIKPSNIMMDTKGTPRIMDMGLAKKKDLSLETKTGAVIGTPAYMPPEQAEGQSLDGRADIYSLGATLYHLLTDRPPFFGDQMKILLAIATEYPLAPESIRKTIPPKLSRICNKAMEKNPSDRYGSAAEMEEDLRNFIEKKAIKAKPLGLLRILNRWFSQNTALAVTLLVSLLAIVSLSTFFMISLVQKTREAEESARIAQEAERRSDLDRQIFELVAETRAIMSKGATFGEICSKIDKIIALDPTNITGRLLLLDLSDENFRSEKERLVVGKKLEEHPIPDARIYNALFELYIQMEDTLEKGRAFKEQARKIAGKNSDIALYYLATDFMVAKKYQEAIQTANQCLETNPNYFFAYKLLSRTYQWSGDDKKAVEMLDTLIRKNPTDYQAYTIRGEVIMRQLEAVQQKNPNSPEISKLNDQYLENQLSLIRVTTNQHVQGAYYYAAYTYSNKGDLWNASAFAAISLFHARSLHQSQTDPKAKAALLANIKKNEDGVIRLHEHIAGNCSQEMANNFVEEGYNQQQQKNYLYAHACYFSALGIYQAIVDKTPEAQRKSLGVIYDNIAKLKKLVPQMEQGIRTKK
ncbi:MAG: serine/threonine protein kinase, bacterial [Parcubacteria group bacterium Gr01-1014_18]|nr:MAG: serine/threonine protein kinase, bacterial [Parcubacteria group bacterium Greene0416_36]TSC81391.1 MAG: serine/threonine protein kinase, bacterial [Parcubacteria group bacterium Gr01-1014_18]TSC99423.1 MAG: serine/threonine protein kinase, bacterial [Parcubacteria group bacterium Greene1014_20]TSD07658.1 MAG: serine/threonine protein kinase, bacterial [Parcubacteria group bacterium Greene0714_2]